MAQEFDWLPAVDAPEDTEADLSWLPSVEDDVTTGEDIDWLPPVDTPATRGTSTATIPFFLKRFGAAVPQAGASLAAFQQQAGRALQSFERKRQGFIRTITKPFKSDFLTKVVSRATDPNKLPFRESANMDSETLGQTLFDAGEGAREFFTKVSQHPLLYAEEPGWDEPHKKILGLVGQAGPLMLTAGAITATTGSPLLGASVFFPVSSGEFYLEAVDAGVDEDFAQVLAVINGAAQVGLESIPLGYMKKMRPLWGKAALRKLLRMGLTESTEEILQGLSENTLKIIGWKGTKNFKQDITEGLLESAIAGFFSGPIYYGSTSMIQGKDAGLPSEKQDMVADMDRQATKTINKINTQRKAEGQEPLTHKQTKEIRKEYKNAIEKLYDDMVKKGNIKDFKKALIKQGFLGEHWNTYTKMAFWGDVVEAGKVVEGSKIADAKTNNAAFLSSKMYEDLRNVLSDAVERRSADPRKKTWKVDGQRNATIEDVHTIFADLILNYMANYRLVHQMDLTNNKPQSPEDLDRIYYENTSEGQQVEHNRALFDIATGMIDLLLDKGVTPIALLGDDKGPVTREYDVNAVEGKGDTPTQMIYNFKELRTMPLNEYAAYLAGRRIDPTSLVFLWNTIGEQTDQYISAAYGAFRNEYFKHPGSVKDQTVVLLESFDLNSDQINALFTGKMTPEQVLDQIKESKPMSEKEYNRRLVDILDALAAVTDKEITFESKLAKFLRKQGMSDELAPDIPFTKDLFGVPFKEVPAETRKLANDERILSTVFDTTQLQFPFVKKMDSDQMKQDINDLFKQRQGTNEQQQRDLAGKTTVKYLITEKLNNLIGNIRDWLSLGYRISLNDEARRQGRTMEQLINEYLRDTRQGVTKFYVLNKATGDPVWFDSFDAAAEYAQKHYAGEFNKGEELSRYLERKEGRIGLGVPSKSQNKIIKSIEDSNLPDSVKKWAGNIVFRKGIAGSAQQIFAKSGASKRLLKKGIDEPLAGSFAVNEKLNVDKIKNRREFSAFVDGALIRLIQPMRSNRSAWNQLVASAIADGSISDKLTTYFLLKAVGPPAGTKEHWVTSSYLVSYDQAAAQKVGDLLEENPDMTIAQVRTAYRKALVQSAISHLAGVPGTVEEGTMWYSIPHNPTARTNDPMVKTIQALTCDRWCINRAGDAYAYHTGGDLHFCVKDNVVLAGITSKKFGSQERIIIQSYINVGIAPIDHLGEVEAFVSNVMGKDPTRIRSILDARAAKARGQTDATYERGVRPGAETPENIAMEVYLATGNERSMAVWEAVYPQLSKAEARTRHALAQMHRRLRWYEAVDDMYAQSVLAIGVLEEQAGTPVQDRMQFPEDNPPLVQESTDMLNMVEELEPYVRTLALINEVETGRRYIYTPRTEATMRMETYELEAREAATIEAVQNNQMYAQTVAQLAHMEPETLLTIKSEIDDKGRLIRYLDLIIFASEPYDRQVFDLLEGEEIESLKEYWETFYQKRNEKYKKAYDLGLRLFEKNALTVLNYGLFSREMKAIMPELVRDKALLSFYQERYGFEIGDTPELREGEYIAGEKPEIRKDYAREITDPNKRMARYNRGLRKIGRKVAALRKRLQSELQPLVDKGELSQQEMTRKIYRAEQYLWEQEENKRQKRGKSFARLLRSNRKLRSTLEEASTKTGKQQMRIGKYQQRIESWGTTGPGRALLPSLGPTGIESAYDFVNDLIIMDETLAPEVAQKKLLHELFHRGVIQVSKDVGGMQELYDVFAPAKEILMQAAPQLMLEGGYATFDEMVQEYGFDMNTQEGELEMLVELSARWAEKFSTQDPPSWWQRILVSIKAWVKRFFGIEYTENDVNDLISGFVYYGATKGLPKAQAPPSKKLFTPAKPEPMNFKMKPSENIFKKKTSTIDLIKEGRRTSTTRSYWRNGTPKVGQVITFTDEKSGKSAKVMVTNVTKITSQMAKDPQFQQQWSRKEGWTVEAGKKYIKPGSYQVEFELYDGKIESVFKRKGKRSAEESGRPFYSQQSHVSGDKVIDYTPGAETIDYNDERLLRNAAQFFGLELKNKLPVQIDGALFTALDAFGFASKEMAASGIMDNPIGWVNYLTNIKNSLFDNLDVETEEYGISETQADLAERDRMVKQWTPEEQEVYAILGLERMMDKMDSGDPNVSADNFPKGMVGFQLNGPIQLNALEVQGIDVTEGKQVILGMDKVTSNFGFEVDTKRQEGGYPTILLKDGYTIRISAHEFIEATKKYPGAFKFIMPDGDLNLTGWTEQEKSDYAKEHYFADQKLKSLGAAAAGGKNSFNVRGKSLLLEFLLQVKRNKWFNWVTKGRTFQTARTFMGNKRFTDMMGQRGVDINKVPEFQEIKDVIYSDRLYRQYATEAAMNIMNGYYKPIFDAIETTLTQRIAATLAEPNPKTRLQTARQKAFEATMEIFFLAAEEVGSAKDGSFFITRLGHKHKYATTDVIRGNKNTEAETYEKLINKYHKLLGLPFTSYTQQDIKTERPELVFFNMLKSSKLDPTGVLQKILIDYKANVESVLLKDMIANGVFNNTSLYLNVTRGWSHRFWTLKGAQKEMQGLISSFGSKRIHRADYRTNGVFLEASRFEDINPIARWDVAAGHYLAESMMNINQAQMLSRLAKFKHPEQPDLPLIAYEYSQEIKDRAKAENRGVNGVLSAHGYVQMRDAPGLTNWVRGSFFNPYVHKSLIPIIQYMYKIGEFRNVRGKLHKFNMLQNYIKRILTGNPYDSYLLFASGAALNLPIKQVYEKILKPMPVLHPVHMFKRAAEVREKINNNEYDPLEDRADDMPNLPLFIKHGFTAYNWSRAMKSLWDREELGQHPQMQSELDKISLKAETIGGFNVTVFQDYIAPAVYAATDHMFKHFIDEAAPNYDQLPPERQAEITDNAARKAVHYMNTVSFLLNTNMFGKEGQLYSLALFTRGLTVGFGKILTGALYQPFSNWKWAPNWLQNIGLTKHFHKYYASNGRGMLNAIMNAEVSTTDMKDLSPLYARHMAKALGVKYAMMALLQYALSFFDDDEEPDEKKRFIWNNERQKKLTVRLPFRDRSQRRLYLDFQFLRSANHLVDVTAAIWDRHNAVGKGFLEWLKSRANLGVGWFIDFWTNRDNFTGVEIAAPADQAPFGERFWDSFGRMLERSVSPLGFRREDWPKTDKFWVDAPLWFFNLYGASLRRGFPAERGTDPQEYYELRKTEDIWRRKQRKRREDLRYMSDEQVRRAPVDELFTPKQKKNYLLNRKRPVRALRRRLRSTKSKYERLFK